VSADLQVEVKGLGRAMAANLRLIAAAKPKGALGQAIKRGLILAHRYVMAITHVDTGTLKKSHRMAIEESITETRGMISIDPGARNTRTGAFPSVYGPAEHARGGSHAFYQRAEAEIGGRTLAEMARIVRVACDSGAIGSLGRALLAGAESVAWSLE